MNSATDISKDSSVPLYARFSRRLRAIFVDWLLALAVIYCGLSLSIAFDNDNFSRVVGVLVIAALLLYEPLLVSRTGGTIGHYFANLRVVDDATHGNISFFKAATRAIIKNLLGWFSFLTMLIGRRNQAIHDLLTASTVQIRDRAKALPYQYIAARTSFTPTIG